jgi:hypothetical protein
MAFRESGMSKLSIIQHAGLECAIAKTKKIKKEQKNHPPPTPQGEPRFQLTLLFMQFVGLPKFFESHRREIVLAWSPEIRSRMDRGLLVLRLFVSSGVPIPYLVTERGGVAAMQVSGTAGLLCLSCL